MVHETITTLSADEVLARAKRFFTERVTPNAVFPQKEGPGFLLLRGQGGEEVALAVIASDAGTRVRGSTLLFDNTVQRFLSTLPVPTGEPA